MKRIEQKSKPKNVQNRYDTYAFCDIDKAEITSMFIWHSARRKFLFFGAHRGRPFRGLNYAKFVPAFAFLKIRPSHAQASAESSMILDNS